MTTKDLRASMDIRARRQAFRQLVAARDAELLPGAANALTARIIEDLGYRAVYLTGAGVTNTELGLPDLGLVTVNDMAEAAQRIGDVCNLPLVADIDTGFGNAVNTYRTVRVMERAGAAALQIEDQVFPKKCGHFSGKAVVPLPEMLAKIRACTDARQDENLLIIARTDARAVEGMSAALDRAAAMAEAGADILFVEAPESDEEIRQIGALPQPQLVNIVMGGKTPMLSLPDLRAAGFSLVLYANAALQASVLAIREVLEGLRDQGSLHGLESRLASFEERQRIVAKAFFDDLEQRYSGP